MGFIGGKGFFLTGPGYDSGSNCLTLFEVVFMETAGYIIVGAVCERITFWAFLLCELFIGAILYPISGCWTWGGGWLSQVGSTLNLGHGYVDFAGSTVVHAVGGFCAMALAIILGPRLGKYGPGGKIRVFPRAQHRLRRDWHIHFVVWMDGFQSRFYSGRDGSSHFRSRSEYEPGRSRRLCRSHAVVVFRVREARHNHGLQRNAGGTSRHHSPVCLRVSNFCNSHWHTGGLPGFVAAFSSTIVFLRSMIPAARYQYTGTAAGWELFPWEFLPTVPTAPDGMAWGGVLSGTGRPRRNGLAPRRYAAVPVPAHGSDFVCRMGVRCNLRRLLGRQQSKKHESISAGGKKKVSTIPSLAWEVIRKTP